MLTKKYTCPYCFMTNELKGILFRCESDPRICALEDDPIYANHIGVRAKLMGRAFTPIKGWMEIGTIKEAPCPFCKETSKARICETCHSELPYTTGEFKDLILAVIGAKDTGKSHYICVLIDQIYNEIGFKFKANLHPLNDETVKRYREDFYNPVFRDKIVIRSTHSATANKNVRVPLSFSLSFSGKGILGRKTIRDVASITFFDTAGEDLDADDTMSKVNKYIYNSQGLILLLDPLQIPSVYSMLSGKIDLPEKNTESNDILARTINLIRKARNISQDKKIPIPIAVAFTKCDALVDLISPQSSLRYPSNHQGSFDIADFEAINGEMQTLLRTWAGERMVNQLENNFKDFAIFGLSALGSNPGKSHNLKSIRPIRVADPFLWLLYKHKLIPGKERRS